MRRLSLLAVLLAFLPVAAYAQAAAVFSETQTCTAGSCTRSAPTSNAEGASLLGIHGWRVSVCAAAGQTLSGAGTLQVYLCDSSSALCMRNPTLDLSVTASGVRCQVFPDFVVGSVTYWPDTVVPAATAVTVSGGASVTVRVYVWNGY